MELYQILYLSAVFMAVLEIFTTTFILLGFSIGFIAVGLLEQLTLQKSYTINLIIFTVVSCLAIFGFRKFFRDKTDVKHCDEDVNQY